MAKLICAWCGEEFERLHVKGPTPRYCRPSHRQRAFEARQLDKRIGQLEQDVRTLTERLDKLDL